MHSAAVCRLPVLRYLTRSLGDVFLSCSHAFSYLVAVSMMASLLRYSYVCCSLYSRWVS